MAFNFNPPLGATTTGNALPVAIATDQIGDVFITGQSGQSALGNNILLATAGTDSIDTMSYSPPLRSLTVQIIGSAGITAGAVTFEQSNNGTTWFAMNAYEASQYIATPPAYVGVLTVTANANRIYTARFHCRYVRLRISTAFVGGTVQAITRFTSNDITPFATAVVPYNAAWAVSAAPNTANVATTALTTASTNAAVVVNAARTLYGMVLSNPTATPAYLKLYNKATTPTVGTDVPVATYPIPANSTVSDGYPWGFRFSAGISYAVTGGIADNDTSNAPAGIHVNFQWYY